MRAPTRSVSVRGQIDFLDRERREFEGVNDEADHNRGGGRHRRGRALARERLAAARAALAATREA